MIKKIILSFLAFAFMSSAHATDLMDAFRDAFYNDPTYKFTVKQILANKEIYPQARSALLPALSGIGDMRRTTYFHQKLATVQGGFTELNPRAFGSHDYLFTLSQPILNYTSISLLRSARFQVKQAN